MKKLKNWINEIRAKIQERSDKKFLSQLERVIQNNYIKASPIIDGYLLASQNIGCMGLGGHFDKPIDRLRYDYEHPLKTIIDVKNSEGSKPQLEA